MAHQKNVKPQSQYNIRSKKVNYKDYQLWKILPKSKDDINALEDYKNSDDGKGLDWWNGPSSRFVRS